MKTSRRIMVIAVGVIGAAVAFASPAAADPPGLVSNSTTSAATSNDKAVFSGCPAGTVVSGGGGYLTAPAAAHQGLVALDRLEPLANGSGFVATMREVAPDPGNWALTADALCVTPPAGYQVVSHTEPVETQVSSVTCPTQKHVIGVGGRINNGQGDVILDYVVPNAALTSVTVRGTPIPGVFPVGWSVTAFAVCADVAAPQRVSFASGFGAAASKSVSMSCPAGTGLYSTGAQISPGSGNVFLDLVHAVTTHSFGARASARAGFGGAWTLFTYGICA
jgi:hypothetical protein